MSIYRRIRRTSLTAPCRKGRWTTTRRNSTVGSSPRGVWICSFWVWVETAHIGFNEPSDLSIQEAIRLPSRAIELNAETRALYAEEFGGIDRVPTRALTVGVAPILAAREIVVLAFGPNKAEPVARSLLGPISANVPGSLLKTVADKVVWMLDREAARLLEA